MLTVIGPGLDSLEDNIDIRFGHQLPSGARSFSGSKFSLTPVTEVGRTHFHRLLTPQKEKFIFPRSSPFD